MPLEMRPTSKWWYGRYKHNGKIHCINLGVQIDGERPGSITQKGDGAFEQTRKQAQKKLDKTLEEIQERRQSTEYVQKLHEIRTGHRIESIPVEQLPSAWESAARKRKGSPRYVQQAHSRFKMFVQFVQGRYPDVKTLADVTPEVASAFMRSQRERNVDGKSHAVSGRTWNAALILMRSAFKALTLDANLSRNPFDGIVTADEETIHRMPFTEEELQLILAAAAKDEFIRPIIVTGVCTAMRRGDCCLMRWKDADLKENFVRVKTSKTGETVEIPLFPMLKEELQKHAGNKSEFVFPKQAAMYRENPHGVTYRVKNVLEAAGFYNKEAEDAAEPDHAPLTDAEPGELLAAAGKALAAVPEGKMASSRRERMLQGLTLYMGGAAVAKVARVLKVSQSTVSLDLNAVQDLIGLRVLRGPALDAHPPHRGNANQKRDDRLRNASVRDFHSFRVTWITLALSAGVPLELVQRVTGHKTAAVVLKHYFKPGREQFRQAIVSAMPRMLTGDVATMGKPIPQQIREICDRMTVKTYERDATLIAELAAKLTA